MAGARARDVAAHAGVSVGSVSNYFNRPELVSIENRERIRAAIDELDYVPNASARELRGGGPPTIGYLTFEIDNPFSAAVYEGADLRAAELGYTLITASSRGDVAREAEYLGLFERRRFSGIIASPSSLVGGTLGAIHRRGTAVAAVDWSMTDAPFPIVGVDDRLGGELAARHLVEQGFRTIVFAGADDHLDLVRRRLEGVRSVVDATPGVDLEVAEFTERSVAGGRKWAASRPRDGESVGYVGVNDLVALGILQALGERVRDGVDGVIGFDDLDILHDVVPLSSIHRPSHDLGRLAVDAIDSALRGEGTPEQVWLEPHLVARASSVRRA